MSNSGHIFCFSQETEEGAGHRQTEAEQDSQDEQDEVLARRAGAVTHFTPQACEGCPAADLIHLLCVWRTPPADPFHSLCTWQTPSVCVKDSWPLSLVCEGCSQLTIFTHCVSEGRSQLTVVTHCVSEGCSQLTHLGARMRRRSLFTSCVCEGHTVCWASSLCVCEGCTARWLHSLLV